MSEEEQGNHGDQSSRFNSSIDILQTIGFLKFKATENYRKGDIESWYYEWQQIRIQLTGKMTNEEYEHFMDIEKRISFVINKISKSKGYQKLLLLLVHGYIRQIQVIIEKWGMGLVNKTDETRFA